MSNRPAKRLLIASQKGGVGKTTTVANLAAALSRLGKKVLIIDLDPQGCLGESFGLKRGTPKRGIFDLFVLDRPIEALLHEIVDTNIHLIPSNVNSSIAEDAFEKASQNRSLLAHRLREIENYFDYIIFDSPPGMGNLTILGMVTAQSVIVPLQPEPFSISTRNAFLRLMWAVRYSLNPNLGLEGILFTMFDTRISSAIRIIEQTRREMIGYVLNTIIPRSVALANAVEIGIPLVILEPDVPGSRAYINLADELLNRKRTADLASVEPRIS